MARRLILICLWLASLLAMVLALAMSLLQLLGGSEDEALSSRAGKGTRAGVWHWCSTGSTRCTARKALKQTKAGLSLLSR